MPLGLDMRSDALRHGCWAAALLACAATPWSARAGPTAEAETSFRIAGAQQPAPAREYAPPGLESASPTWEFSASPYAWLAGLKGDSGVSPRLPPATVDASIGDILDALKFAGMAMFEARRGRFVGVADIAYIDLSTSKNVGVRDPGLVNAKLGSKMFISTLAAGYRVVDQDPFYVDLLGGARLVNQDLDLKFSGPNRALEGSTSEFWADPVVGARMHGPLGGKWSYAAYGDIGGFGVSSRLTWQLLGVVQYQVTRDWTLSAGWRHLDIDYRNDGFVFDAAMDGPIIGASYRF